MNTNLMTFPMGVTLLAIFLILGTTSGCNKAKNLDSGKRAKVERNVVDAKVEMTFHIKDFRKDLKKRWKKNPLGARTYYEGKTVLVSGTLGPKPEAGDSYELRGAGTNFAYITPHKTKGQSLKDTAPGSEIQAKCVIAVIDTMADSKSDPKDIGFYGCILN